MAFINDDETLRVFKEESLDHLNGIENDLLAIEEAGAEIDQDLVNSVFRAMHSIKGGAGFLGMNAVKSLAHAAEDVMNRIRNAELVPSATVISSLLDAADYITRLLRQPKGSPEFDIAAPLAALHTVLATFGDQTPPSSATVPAAPSPAANLPALNELIATHGAAIDDQRLAGHKIFVLSLDAISDSVPQVQNPANILKDLGSIGQVIGVLLDGQSVDPLDQAIDNCQLPIQILFSSLMDKEMVVSFAQVPADRTLEVPASAVAFSPTAPLAAAEDERPAPPPPPPQAAAAAAKQASAGPDSSLRVNVRLLDTLMTLAGELVLTRNQFLQTVHSPDRPDLDAVSQRLNLVTSGLQEAIMSTRMQPVGNVFSKFKRVVRDIAQKLGKEIELSLEGGEVEMDKTIIEALADPLTHLVRNSVDHGIEVPEVRIRAGKPPTGTLQIKAFHEGGHVIIEIIDDGAGIDTDRLKEKALSMGTHDKFQLEAMQEHELLRLIFMPGLSTAREVTEVSGRGVGMDVVHSNLSKIGGVFDIASQKGQGTTITIKLPLTLAIIPSLIVGVAEERYAIPQVNMVELVRVSAARLTERIERLGSAQVLRLRGNLLPLVSLAEVLGIEERRDSLPRAVNILVMAVGKFHYGLMVDTLLDSEEIVVKPLGSHLRKCQVYAGATIQGDGRVALILDVVGISKVMNLAAVSDRMGGKVQPRGALVNPLSQSDSQSLLLVRNAPQEQFAIPMHLVSRIEKIKCQQIESTGGRRSMQYRGSTLPLFSIDEVAPRFSSPAEEASHLYVVVFPFGNRVIGIEIGIMVSAIIDIISVSPTIDDTTHKQPGIMGSAIINQQITLLLDPFELVTTLVPEWLKYTQLASSASGKDRHILVVEDFPFFNRQICEFVLAAGYQVFSATDGLEGLSILEREHIDLVLTDIEMPNMDGLELTARIRAEPRWAALPVIAVTSLSGEAAEKRGKKAGINEYLIKLDREKILDAINRHLN